MARTNEQDFSYEYRFIVDTAEELQATAELTAEGFNIRQMYQEDTHTGASDALSGYRYVIFAQRRGDYRPAPREK